MITKLYVGNINYNAQEIDLIDLFSKYGNVLDVKIVTDIDTLKSKGYGFIEMENKNDAEEAVSTLNDSIWMDRQIIVNISRERKVRSRSINN